MTRLRSAILLAFAALGLTATAAQAVSSKALLALDVVVADKGMPDDYRHFGPVKKLLAALKRQGWTCQYSPYEHGADIHCRAAGRKEFLIDLVAVPTLAPDFAEIDSVRPDGINSTPLPPGEIGDFLGGTLRLKDTSAKR